MMMKRPSNGVALLERLPTGAPLRMILISYSTRVFHGLSTDKVDIAKYADLKVGVVPVMNLEWIQKLHRDKSKRGYSTEAVTDTIYGGCTITCTTFARSLP